MKQTTRKFYALIDNKAVEFDSLRKRNRFIDASILLFGKQAESADRRIAIKYPRFKQSGLLGPLCSKPWPEGGDSGTD